MALFPVVGFEQLPSDDGLDLGIWLPGPEIAYACISIIEFLKKSSRLLGDKSSRNGFPRHIKYFPITIDQNQPTITNFENSLPLQFLMYFQVIKTNCLYKLF